MRDNGACRVETEAKFLRLLEVEHQRAARSGRSFVLLQIQLPETRTAPEGLLEKVCSELRETDWVAWREGQRKLSAVCTELGATDPEAAVEAIRQRLEARLTTEAGGSSVKLAFETVAAGGAETNSGQRESMEAALAL